MNGTTRDMGAGWAIWAEFGQHRTTVQKNGVQILSQGRVGAFEEGVGGGELVGGGAGTRSQ